ncbi:Coenzyme F420 hydrogenase/dehydrogenase, beta subunit C-terminal domain [Halanaerobium kushneri]|uniref:Coenzyme F420 hydrogenase subunit beta n=1 Tax=Halanaerobium kushneri TaxID=56779 RepID=A0A1N6S038_9FIRM|nr:Coenzyme F420 hydrogenase/dehydrogenase, beta subunit C-terminal domain [Halanaerobium kushneri]SIQ34411.1 coenzyme F420 hydrogenase subunit beta [Halanaerobium kushneri]
MKNVGELNLDYLCLGCGSCEVACPVAAVEIKLKNNVYLPEVDNIKCIECDKCLNVCPGTSISLEGYADTLFAADNSGNKDEVLGRYLSNYLAYAADQKLRYEAASGGLATSILIYLLEEGIIEGAVVTKMSEEDKRKSKTFIAQSAEEIKAAKNSKYCSTHPLSALKELRNFESDAKFAFVGLPCHIQGLRKLQQQEKWLRKKIIFSIGLLCTHSVDYSGTEVILDKLASGSKNIKKLEYRGSGWPGKASIEYEDHSSSIPLYDYWSPYFASYFFTPYRCLSCSDLVGELADISLGDAWLKEIEAEDDLGTSIIISRTKFAEKIIREMKVNGIIAAEKISKDKIKESQKKIIMRKKHTIAYRLSLFKIFSKEVPDYGKAYDLSDQSIFQKFKGYLGAFLLWFNSYLSKKEIGIKIIKFIPRSILKKYSSLVNKAAGRKYE